jgi:integrase
VAGRNTFGNVRKLPSKRWQASYWHDGKRHTGPSTFPSKGDANAWLALQAAAIHRGVWIDPGAGRERFVDYAERWLANRHDLRPRTRELYRSELNRHLLPAFGTMSLGKITTAKVRAWRAGIEATKPVTAAKCYRLLRTILATAVEDGKLLVNPCTIKKAGLERSPERPIPTAEQVVTLADALPERYRALVYTAAYAGLRLGECLALTRERVDLVHRTIVVLEQAQRVNGSGRVVMAPKSEAGRRTVAIPKTLADILSDHLARFVGTEPTALLFTGDKGAPVEASNWGPRFRAARDAVGLGSLHFHDLRHFAGTTAASTGASTRELMARLGHASPRAALIYQHATAERDHAIAERVDAVLSKARETPKARVVELASNASRTNRARKGQADRSAKRG